MMKRLLTLFAVAGIALAAHSAPEPYPLKVDSFSPTVKKLEVYRANARTVRVSFFDGTNASALGAATPFLAWATNSVAASMVTSTWAAVSGMTGMVDFTWSPSDLNQEPGRYVYEVGLKNSGSPTVYRHGDFVVRGSPYSAGASAVTLTTPLNFDLYTITGTWGPNFSGASTTGNITSAAGDAGNFLKADGTWSAPSGIGDITGVTAGTGLEGGGLSGGVTLTATNLNTRMGQLEGQTNGYLTSYTESDPIYAASSNAWVRKAGDTMSGGLDMGNNNLDNVADLDVATMSNDSTPVTITAGADISAGDLSFSGSGNIDMSVGGGDILLNGGSSTIEGLYGITFVGGGLGLNMDGADIDMNGGEILNQAAESLWMTDSIGFTNKISMTQADVWFVTNAQSTFGTSNRVYHSGNLNTNSYLTTETDPLAVLATGARAMSGNLDMGGNAVTNIDTLRANQIVVQGLYDPTADTTLIVDVDLRRLTNIVNVAFSDGTVQTSAITPETDPVWTAASNTAVYLDAQYPNAVLRDGSRAMTRPLNFGTYWPTNMSRIWSSDALALRLDTGQFLLVDYNLNLGGKIATNGTYYGSGVGLTALNGSSISAGTVADARIASTIARDSELSNDLYPAFTNMNKSTLLLNDLAPSDGQVLTVDVTASVTTAVWSASAGGGGGAESPAATDRFHVTTSTTSCGNLAWTTVGFNTEQYDPDGVFSSTTITFSDTGWCSVVWCIYPESSVIDDGEIWQSSLFINGEEHSRGGEGYSPRASGNPASDGATMFYNDVSTNQYRVRIFHNEGSSVQAANSATKARFSGFRFKNQGE